MNQNYKENNVYARHINPFFLNPNNQLHFSYSRHLRQKRSNMMTFLFKLLVWENHRQLKKTKNYK